MDEAEYLKCPCKECGNNIEFPPAAARTTVTCPHCGQWTELAPPKSHKDEKDYGGTRIPLVPLLAGVLVLAVAIFAGVWYLHQKPVGADTQLTKKAPRMMAATPVAKKATKSVPIASPTPSTQAEAQVPVAPPVTHSPPRAKSPDDLKVGTIELEKTKGSSLVYAVGTLQNDSEYERYGVRINLDLLNAKGIKIGTATDYAESLLPHQQWQFRAMVTAPKTASVRFASLKED